MLTQKQNPIKEHKDIFWSDGYVDNDCENDIMGLCIYPNSSWFIYQICIIFWYRIKPKRRDVESDGILGHPVDCLLDISNRIVSQLSWFSKLFLRWKVHKPPTLRVWVWTLFMLLISSMILGLLSLSLTFGSTQMDVYGLVFNEKPMNIKS